MNLFCARMLDSNKLVICKFYLTLHLFHARPKSLTCTTYGKYLREGIMAVLTPKSVIPVTLNHFLTHFAIIIFNYAEISVFVALCNKFFQKIPKRACAA